MMFITLRTSAFDPYTTALLNDYMLEVEYSECWCVFGETVTSLALSTEHLHVPQTFPQIAAQRHVTRGIDLRAAPNGAVRVGPEKHQWAEHWKKQQLQHLLQTPTQ